MNFNQLLLHLLSFENMTHHGIKYTIWFVGPNLTKNGIFCLKEDKEHYHRILHI